MIAKTPHPPYYAVIFTSLRTSVEDGYDKMAELMEELASVQEGYLGIESARNELGITISYWKDLASIKKWKAHLEHQMAQAKGKSVWYEEYSVRISKVERDYSFKKTK